MSESRKRPGGVPPEEFRYGKGQTGNPNGRPKGRKNNKTIFRQELESGITILQNGKRRRIKRGEAIVKRTVNDAIEGKDRAREFVLRIAEQIDRDLEEKAAIKLREEDEAILDRYIEREIARRNRLKGEGEES